MRTIVILVALVAAGCSGGHGGGVAGDCAGLALDACRQAPGCAPNLCDSCTCLPTYRGCIPDDVVPSPCPELGCPSPMCCGATDTCGNGTACAPPGTPQGCGACNTEPSSCATDQECMAMGASMICDPIRCSCAGNTACVQGCTDDMACAEGQSCNLATARCEPRACGEANGPCPPDFDCAAGRCARQTCTSDGDCNDYCVLGQCYQEPGTCTPPAA